MGKNQRAKSGKTVVKPMAKPIPFTEVTSLTPVSKTVVRTKTLAETGGPTVLQEAEYRIGSKNYRIVFNPEAGFTGIFEIKTSSGKKELIDVEPKVAASIVKTMKQRGLLKTK